MKFEKFFKGGLAVAMAASLAACGSSSSTSSSTAAASDTAAAESASAATAATSSKPFVLGGSGPITGDAAVYGLAVMHGAQIAVDEINAAGGKVSFDFHFEDDQADGEQAVSAYNTLVDDGMQVSLLTTTSGAGQSVAPLYKEDNIFAITPSGSSTAIVYQDATNEANPYGNVFQMCFTDPNQGRASADYIAEHSDLGTKIAVIYRNDDNYSNGLYTKFMEEAEAKGLSIVYQGAFQEGTTDFSVYIQGAQSAGADLVFLPIYYQPASQILSAASNAGYAPTFFGCDGMDGILTLEGFDTSLAEGLYMLTPFSADASDEKTQSFVTKYKEAYGETPNQFAADAYDSVYAIAQALEASDVTADSSTDDITAALIAQFTSMTFDGITGTGVTWSADGTVSKDPKAVVIKDGAYVSAE
ncbi:ABC transporter substrate-binding protein [Anaerolactibacter massiliensis]|uniref:ABC transporter substrate-binding protein n=1 Tax=Anaerolactibacter massiliensis TaxID=2044573 RepID=UPI000CF97C94|nr:ABC transporter substrate-binding protein [Anaerolactibacter massiliensis]